MPYLPLSGLAEPSPSPGVHGYLMRTIPGCISVLPAIAAKISGARTYVYKTGSGRDLVANVLGLQDSITAARPSVLFFFGGGWREGDLREFEPQARLLANAGFVAVLVDYRVTCRDNTTALDSVADAEDAYSWVLDNADTLGIDRHRIVLSGGSAGGHLALVTALRADKTKRPLGLVLFNPAVDLLRVAPFLRLTQEQAASISPTYMALSGLPPTLIFHGDKDGAVPIVTVREFCAKASAAQARCTLQEYKGEGHGFYARTKLVPPEIRSPFIDTLRSFSAFLRSLGVT